MRVKMLPFECASPATQRLLRQARPLAEAAVRDADLHDYCFRPVKESLILRSEPPSDSVRSSSVGHTVRLSIDMGPPCAGFGENLSRGNIEPDRSVTTILLPEEH